MNTKWGITALIVGGYLLALGIAGINANSGGARVLFSVVLAAGFVVAGWSVVLPWDAGTAHREPEVPGAVPRA
jgi:hypothetical protein